MRPVPTGKTVRLTSSAGVPFYARGREVGEAPVTCKVTAVEGRISHQSGDTVHFSTVAWWRSAETARGTCALVRVQSGAVVATADMYRMTESVSAPRRTRALLVSVGIVTVALSGLLLYWLEHLELNP